MRMRPCVTNSIHSRGCPAACVLIPPSVLRIRFADYGGGGGIDSGLRPSPLRGCASRSLCLFKAVELRFHPTLRFENPLRGLWRRRWDSNPRNLAALRFSRPAQSTTLPPLLYNNNQQFSISDHTQETCLLPITCQLSECSAIQDAGGSEQNYTDLESVFASFSSRPTAKIRFRTAIKRFANPPFTREADPDWLDFMTHLQLGIAVDF